MLDADIVFIGIFTFNAIRGFELARFVKEHSDAIVVMGGLHASMNYTEAINYCDYVLLGEGDESILEFIDAIQKDRVIDFSGVAYLKDKEIIHTGNRKAPEDINTIPNRNLLYRYKKMAGHNTLWPQVHASRGCPHNCDYCAVVRHFGRTVRTRTPDNVVEDIRQAITFHDKRKIPRLSRMLWITDDNFFADREWAISVLNAIIDKGIKYSFTIQARYEVGFDDEIVRSVQNIQSHGLNVRGLFIVGADNHTKGVGNRLADFVIKYDLHGVLIQSMYFVPGTPVYQSNKDRLLHKNWSKYNGNVVHYPKNISPYDLQQEINRVMFVGEYFWQKSVRSDLKRELKNLKKL